MTLHFLLQNPKKSLVEEIKDIDIFRFLEIGWTVKMIGLSGNSIAVNTPKDLEVARKMGH